MILKNKKIKIKEFQRGLNGVDIYLDLMRNYRFPF